MSDHPVEPLAVTVVEQPDGVVVSVSGEVDTATAAQLEAELAGALGRAGGDLSLDLSGVQFLDSSGLRTLIVAQQAVTERGGAVRLVGSTAVVDRLLEVTGLHELFPGP